MIEFIDLIWFEFAPEDIGSKKSEGKKWFFWFILIVIEELFINKNINGLCSYFFSVGDRIGWIPTNSGFFWYAPSFAVFIYLVIEIIIYYFLINKI